MTDEPGSASGSLRLRDRRGGGLRGLFWAILLEAAALSLLAFLIYEWRLLRL